jgi:hypothetical protein
MLSGVSTTPPTLEKLVMSQKLLAENFKSSAERLESTACDSFCILSNAPSVCVRAILLYRLFMHMARLST